jgi:hypothetical protein
MIGPVLVMMVGWIWMGLVSCEGEKSENKKKDRPGTGTQTNPKGEGATVLPEKLEFETLDVLEKKIEVKGYHLLVKEQGENFSGYCIAMSTDPRLPAEALGAFVIKQGACPSSLTIDGSPSKIAYVCKPVPIDGSTTQQVILYGKLQSGGKYQDIRQVSPEVVLAFCANPHG